MIIVVCGRVRGGGRVREKREREREERGRSDHEAYTRRELGEEEDMGCRRGSRTWTLPR